MLMMKYSKTAHIPIIEEIAKGIKAAGNNQRYLELGIAKARCFNRIAPYFEKSYAVDVNFEALLNVSVKTLCVMKCVNTDVFFEQPRNIKFNLIFIDANHAIKNVVADTCHALSVIADEGIIILHDTYAPDEESAPHCKDAWRIQEYLKSDDSLQYINLPFYYGLTIVKKHVKRKWWIE